MQAGDATLLIDDGELEGARALLDELGVEYRTWRGSKFEPPIAIPAHVRILITTARLALALDTRRRPEHLRSTWLAYVQGEARTQRAALRRAGFDVLVPFDAHPVAARTLLLQALFLGQDQQAVPRFSVGSGVRYRVGWGRAREGVLVDLSMDGCRLMGWERARPGSRVRLSLPSPETGRPVRLTGRVVRSDLGAREGGQPGQYALGVRFQGLGTQAQLGLAELLRERAYGPAAWSPRSNPSPGEDVRAAGPSPRQERRTPRGVYERSVEAMCAGATRALLARDLSARGLRVEPTNRIDVRERLRLALYGCATGEPLLIDGHVERDDGDRGLLIHFDSIDDRTQERLAGMIASLPKIRRLADDSDVIAVEIRTHD